MLKDLTDLLIHELKDLHSAETQLVEALPLMEEAAADFDLKEAFRCHLEETKVHVDRLVEVGTLLNVDLTGETCDGMKGLLKEGEETVEAQAEPVVKDAALISAAQRAEHYEIAAYGSAACFADCAGHKKVHQILEKTLEEEKKADCTLTGVAMGSKFSPGLNREAVAHG